MRRAVVVHYHEIGLKGRNRSFFERALVRNLADGIGSLPRERIEILPGRLIVRTPSEPESALLDAVGRTFGVATYAPAADVTADMDAIAATALDLMAERDFATFAIAARRGTKEQPFTSHDVNVEVGARVQTATGAGVNLDAPDVTVHVEVVKGRAYVYVEKFRGPGGLPVGASGRVVSLLSGGIDSPVATWRAMRRGARASLLHFHSVPFTDRGSIRKARELAAILAAWQGETTLYLAPFGEAQQQIVVASPPPLRVVLYRRLMVRVAAEIAAQEGAKALVTGESLGQVASQTLENMAAIDDASPMLVLRPLVGDDKQDIVTQAKAIGSFETSILPYVDCCSLFVPRSPSTHASVEECRRAEEGLDVADLVRRVVKDTEVERIQRPGGA